MPKQNHFTGATLAEAVRNATGAYRKTNALKRSPFVVIYEPILIVRN
ncbi:hypothetical protein [Hyphococcus sp.]